MEIPSKEQQWIETFFSSPNALNWNDLISGEVEDLLRDEVHGWLQLFNNSPVDYPVLVPRVAPEETTWYACSYDDRLNAQTGEELEAMVAHAYASVERYPTLDSTDSSDKALLERFGKHICRVHVASGKEKHVLRMLGIYRQLVERRPERPQIGVRPPGKIRNIFDKALLVGNFEEARNCITELKESGRLDLQNQRFLEIRLLAVQEKWQIIFSDPSYLRTVVDLELPARILADLVEAIYQTRLRQFEDVSDPQGAIADFKEFVLPKFGRLFRARKGLKTPSVLKVFLIEQACSTSPEPSVCQKILAEYPISDPGFNYAQSLLQIVPKEPVAKALVERAQEAFEDDKIELALELYASCPHDKEILVKVLRCSRDVETLTDLQVAWEYCQECPEEWFEILSQKQSKDYAALKEVFTVKPIGNWIDWADFVLEGGDHKEATTIAQKGATEWSIETFFAIDGGVEKFCALLSDGVSASPEFFQRQFPYIYESASSAEKPIAQLRPLYIGLLELLACTETAGETDLALAQDLVQSLFDVGMPIAIYKETLGALDLLWANAKSFTCLPWAMDVSELLAINPSPAPELRSKFFYDVLGYIATISHRVEQSTWMMLDLLAQDYNAIEYVEQLKPVVEKVEEVHEKNPLTGKRIGIYSLTEQAAIRAKQLLEKMYPGIVVDINHDHEATQALENLAKSSDLFVFSWRSSKHQAYFCVKKYVQENCLLMPTGKGSTSIINSIVERISNG